MTEEKDTAVIPNGKSTVLEALDRLKWWTVGLSVGLVLLVLVTFVVRSFDLNRVAENAQQNRIALCALREDLHRRIDAAQRFLENNPGAIPGIPPKEIRESIQNQRRTVAALRVIDCTEIVVPEVA